MKSGMYTANLFYNIGLGQLTIKKCKRNLEVSNRAELGRFPLILAMKKFLATSSSC